jgi:Ca-activated chloride channel family protein
MRRVRYSKFTGEDLELSAEDLMRALGDFFLDSGFQDWWNPNPNAKQTWEGLKNAILQALNDAGYSVEDNPTAGGDGKRYRHVVGLKVL